MGVSFCLLKERLINAFGCAEMALLHDFAYRGFTM